MHENQPCIGPRNNISTSIILIYYMYIYIYNIIIYSNKYYTYYLYTYYTYFYIILYYIMLYYIILYNFKPWWFCFGVTVKIKKCRSNIWLESVFWLSCAVYCQKHFFSSEILLDSVLCYPSLWLKGLLTLSFFLTLTTTMHFLLGFLKPHLINCNVCKTQLLGSWPVPGKMSILHQF